MEKIKCLVVDRHTLQLLEDAHKGDFIDLNELEQVDKSNIEKLYEEGKEEVISDKVRSAKLEAASVYSEEKNAVNIKHTAEIQNIRKEYDTKIEDLKTQLNDLKAKYDKDITLKDNEISNIAERTKNEIEREYEKQLSEKDRTYQLQINDLNNRINTYDSDKAAEIAKKDYDYAIEKNNLENEIRNKEDRISQLERARNSKNIKRIGEDLEQWALREYGQYSMYDFGDRTTFEKANIAIKNEGDGSGTKPDFLFKVYSDKAPHAEDPIMSVCLEMKSESTDSAIKHKNSSFYKKLDEDRNKNNCEYALLVSELELENDNDAPIVKIDGYEKMYMVRPQYMMTFLSIIYSLANKYADLLTAHNKEILDLKSRKEIEDEFNSFKNTYLDKPLATLETKVTKIRDEAAKAQKSVDTISGLANEIIDETLEKMKKKIDNFNIRKIGRELDALESDE